MIDTRPEEIGGRTASPVSFIRLGALALIAGSCWTAAATTPAVAQVVDDRAGAPAITGRLVDGESLAGVPGAIVELIGQDGERLGISLSETDGRFRVPLQAPGGPFRLEVQSVAHAAAVIDSLLVGSDQVVVLPDILLEPAPVVLDPITVMAERRRVTLGQEAIRRHQLRGVGTFLAGAVVALHDPPSLVQYIAERTGLWVRYDSRGRPELYNPESATQCIMVMMNRWPLTYPGIEPHDRPMGFLSLDEIPLEWVAGIEIFNEERDVPELYAWDNGPCGFVNIWTWNSWQ